MSEVREEVREDKTADTEEQATQAGQEAPPAEAGEDLARALEEARALAAEHYDRYLRAAAELDNFRKRTARLRTEARDETLREVLIRVAPALDNMRRALAQESATIESFKQGLELIHDQLQEALKGYGLEEIQAVGQPFDPLCHEALAEVESPEHPPGTVVEEMEKGYRLRDKVVRPARVVVSKTGGQNG